MSDQEDEETFPQSRRSLFYDCAKHGWSALGRPCPKCMAGDAPSHCIKHGWSATGMRCPECTKGMP